MDIALGITTAPRQVATLGECYQSVVAAGWPAPHLFSDGCTASGIDNQTVRPATLARPIFELASGRYGAWRNWVQSLADLLEIEPDADAVMLVQDDVRFCLGVREFLEDGHWRLPGLGLVTLSTSQAYAGECQHRGLNQLDRGRNVIAGACTLLFSRDVAEMVLAHRLSQAKTGWHVMRSGDPRNVRQIDMYVGTIMIELGLSQWGYRPSLADHFGSISTLDSGGNEGPRKTLSFAGADATAAEVFKDADSMAG